MKRITMCGVIGMTSILSVSTIMGAGPDRVKTAGGEIEGTGPQANGVREFKGIPFAAPPVGDLRFAAPQPVERWSGVKQTKAFGPRCMQAALFGDMNFRSNGMGEDCLYLNVWTPAKTGREKLPVLVYFFGGGFQAGDGSEPRYDGESMAAKGIVALTVNYRLGVFGFFVHPDLTKASPHHASGNWALLDQNAAVRWVQDNIGAFGGDPKRVTIAGESAGSIAVSAQMASPLSKDLFAGAIGESGSNPGRPVGGAASRGRGERGKASYRPGGVGSGCIAGDARGSATGGVWQAGHATFQRGSGRIFLPGGSRGYLRGGQAGPCAPISRVELAGAERARRVRAR